MDCWYCSVFIFLNEHFSLKFVLKTVFSFYSQVLSDRYETQDAHQSNNNVDLSDESQVRTLKRKLTEENEEMAKKKKIFEVQYDELYKHIFSVRKYFYIFGRVEAYKFRFLFLRLFFWKFLITLSGRDVKRYCRKY